MSVASSNCITDTLSITAFEEFDLIAKELELSFVIVAVLTPTELKEL
jgi:hypothetical protein